MPAYKFEALNAAGKTTTGLVEADNLKAARAQLRAQSLVPLDVDNILVAGRCISVDAIAFGSTRNVPACTMTGEATAIAAALAAKRNVPTSAITASEVQARLKELGVWLGTPGEDVPDVLRQAS